MFKRLLFAVIFCFSVTANSHLDDSGFSVYSDSGIRGPRYSKIVKRIVELQQQFPGYSEIINLGQSPEGRNIVGLLLFNKPTGLINRMSIITGSTHGNEYLNIADRLPNLFLNNTPESIRQYIHNNGAIFILPVLNPDGYDNRRRRNSHNVDLNRDFPNELIELPGLSQPETNQYVQWVSTLLNRTQARLDIVVDYHCCDGSLLYPFGFTDQRIDTVDLQRHIFIAELMQKQFPTYAHGITGERLGYFPRGTTKDFWYLEYNALGFTFEGQVYAESNKLNQHYLWWSDIFSYFNQAPLPR